MKKVFLGGTCNESPWREQIIPLLEKAGLAYFNPVLSDEEDWGEADKQREIEERTTCDFCLYTITPEMTGVYSIAEVVDDSNKRPEKTILCALQNFNDHEFDEGAWKSIESVGAMVTANGGHFCTNLEAAVLFMYQSEDVSIESMYKLRIPRFLIPR